jgi:hypothetical protein
VVQLGNGHVTFEFPSGCQSGLELQAALQRVGALPCFDLHKLAGDLKVLGLRELSERVVLGLQPRRNIYLRRLQKTREARPKLNH